MLFRCCIYLVDQSFWPFTCCCFFFQGFQKRFAKWKNHRVPRASWFCWSHNTHWSYQRDSPCLPRVPQWPKSFFAIEVLKVNTDKPIDRINMCYVINKITTAKVHSDFSIQQSFFVYFRCANCFLLRYLDNHWPFTYFFFSFQGFQKRFAEWKNHRVPRASWFCWSHNTRWSYRRGSPRRPRVPQWPKSFWTCFGRISLWPRGPGCTR